ncbi:MAG: hypothetical protein HOO96_14345 [Polyangiaceae bacterium]|nr:hypothetical protein [Polyangiaceae bacterium]
MNPLSKGILALRAGYAFLSLVRNPSKLDDVFVILDGLEKTQGGADIVKEFTDNPAHAAAFAARPTLAPVDLQALAQLPAGTLGRAFADEMIARKLDPADIQMRPDDGSEAGFVFRHLRETHDVWHTVTGFDVDVAGELGLQAFYLSQFRARLALIILSMGLLNTCFYAIEDRERRMDAIAHGWRLGRQTKGIFGFDWAAHWETPLEEVRAKLGLVPDARRAEVAAVSQAA